MAEREQAARRRFLGLAGGASLLLSAGAGRGAASERPSGEAEKEAEEISPAEDLMREHGVLDRVLLIYDEAIRRLEARKELDAAVLPGAAGIVRRFIEDYHEKLEESQLFPRFEKAHTLVDLVAVLRLQHEAGRRLTERVRDLAAAGRAAPADSARLAETLRQFVRMYRPHAAREDTVLFPALHRIVSPHEYDAMGEDFERQERRLLGEEGFEKAVDEVAELERRLGLEDLAQFTPAS